ncbi:MAG TPA: GNAT family N-acetyltransferase [Steroidobacteraceae bacterium]|nr:GNAT family N-acetyltransferase [Steroidobacteraceae bacterium]
MALRHQTMDGHLVATGASTDEEEHRARLMYRFDCAEILLQGEEPVGLLKVERGETEWKVIQIQLMPRLQGKGIGEQILRELIEQAGARSLPVTLSVLKANPAKRLYERLGFVVEGEDAHEYFMRRQA